MVRGGQFTRLSSKKKTERYGECLGVLKSLEVQDEGVFFFLREKCQGVLSKSNDAKCLKTWSRTCFFGKQTIAT